MASEIATAQTCFGNETGVRTPIWETRIDRRAFLESKTKQGNSPVVEIYLAPREFQSSTGHVESGVNVGVPSPKAKYDLVTDSE